MYNGKKVGYCGIWKSQSSCVLSVSCLTKAKFGHKDVIMSLSPMHKLEILRCLTPLSEVSYSLSCLIVSLSSLGSLNLGNSYSMCVCVCFWIDMSSLILCYGLLADSKNIYKLSLWFLFCPSWSVYSICFFLIKTFRYLWCYVEFIYERFEGFCTDFHCLRSCNGFRHAFEGILPLLFWFARLTLYWKKGSMVSGASYVFLFSLFVCFCFLGIQVHAVRS